MEKLISLRPSQWVLKTDSSKASQNIKQSLKPIEKFKWVLWAVKRKPEWVWS